MPFSRFTLLSLALFSCSSFANNIPKHLDYLPSGSRTAVIVESLPTHNIEYQQKQNELLPPASTLKLATALAARLALGKDFTFSTTLYKQDDDAILTFTGDPSLSREQLSTLFNDSNLKTIKGDLWIDGTIFTGYERAVGWPWDILGVCYSAPSSALSIDENCVQASITTHDDGSTKVFVPIHQPISFSSNAKSVTREEQKKSFCDLELTTQGNHYKLNGCLVNRNKPLPLKFAVQDTQDFTEQTILKVLGEHNISLNGEVRFGKPEEEHQPLTVLAQHKSKPLMALLEHMLKKSDNHYADNLTKMLGHLNYQQAGSFTNGTAAIKDILLKQADIDLSNAVLVDGSGLSRNNRMTANQMRSILHYIYKYDKELELLALLPTSGIDGTLKYRNSMRKAPIKGGMTSKSGSLFGSYNMAGFAGLENKDPQLFVQFVADYHPVAAKEGSTPVERPIDTFEKSFYQDLIELSKD